MTLELSPGSGRFRIELERMPGQSGGIGDERCEEGRRNKESVIGLLLGVRERETSGTSSLVSGGALC